MYLEELLRHYIQTKLAILELIVNKIADKYPELKEDIEIKRNRIEINSDLCSCYVDIEEGGFKIVIDGKTPYSYQDVNTILEEIGDEIDNNK